MKQRLEQELEDFGDSLAGIIIEPVLGSGGVITLPEWYVHRIDIYAKEHDILIAFDEVATGFGRTGKMFCYQHYNIKPDIITMSKAMNNGILPIGAVAVSKKSWNNLESIRNLYFICLRKMGTLCVALQQLPL